MRLTTVILLASLMQVSASTFGQRITLNKQNAPLKLVLKEIRRQSGYDIFYDNRIMPANQKVSVFVNISSIEEALNSAFRGLDLVYSIDGRTVSITKKEPVNFNLIDRFIQITVRGTVLDEKGQALVGATVKVKGSTKAVTTNDKGEFMLLGVEENAALEISFIGFKTQLISAKANLGSITLEVLTADLATVDIVNTGYQTLSKERSTGSFGVVSKEQLEKPASNIAQRLIGTVAGLQARTMDVNGNPVFEIRGQSSLLANASPLVVVNGFPIQGDFNNINPNDVESVTILKDAAAASIWGARAANGVIVITTKKAKNGAPLNVEFNAFTKIGSKVDLDYVRPLASSAETVEYEKLSYTNWRAFGNATSLPNAAEPWSTAGIALNEANYGFITTAERDARLEALKKLDNKQQIADNLLANPTSSQFNLSLSGGTEKMANHASLFHEDYQSNFKGSGNKRYMLNFRSTMELAKWINLDLTGMYHYQKEVNNGVTLSDIQSWSPYDMLINPDGSLTNLQRYYTPLLERLVPMNKFPYANWEYNPIQEIENRERSTEATQARIQGAMTFKIIPGLSAVITGQYELGNRYTRNLSNENTFEVRSAVNQATYWNQAVTPHTFTANLPKGSILSQGRGKVDSYNLRGQVNFNRTFAEKHDVAVLGGIEFQNVVNQTSNNPIAYGYNDETLGVGSFINGPGLTAFPIRDWQGFNQTFAYINSFGYNTQRLYSAMANVGYTYNGKYTISGSYKVDASNLISDDPDYRYNPFYSAGLAWQGHKENFISNINWIDRLTARLTYGHTGNYDPNTGVNPLITPSATPNIYSNEYTATFSSFGNPTLRWERTAQWNLALDFSLFKSKLFGSVEFYDKYGKDLLATISIPAAQGTTSQRLNNAEMRNKGIELVLGTVVKLKSDFSWRANINLSFNDNEIKKLFVANYAASTLYAGGTGAYVVGENPNSIWRFQYAGVINNQPSVYGANGSTYDFQAFTPGDGRNYMLNMGTLVAPYTMGINNSFRYKQLDFSFIITGKFGHVFQRTGFNYPAHLGSRVLPNSFLSEVLTGDPSQIVPLPLNPNDTRYFFWDRFYPNLSYMVANASHVRMQEVNLTYSLPSKISNKIGLSRLMIYGQGNDLFTIYANKFQEDPEYRMGTMKPMPRYTFGLKCNF